MMNYKQYLINLFESSETNDLENSLKALKSKLAYAAQKVYDEWDQNEDGEDDILGSGGICQDIADAMASVLLDNGIDVVIADTEGQGDQHVWVVAYDEKTKDAFNVDISPSLYEIGSGYVWKKKPNIIFDSSDIEIYPADYETVEYYLG